VSGRRQTLPSQAMFIPSEVSWKLSPFLGFAGRAAVAPTVIMVEAEPAALTQPLCSMTVASKSATSMVEPSAQE
jgi:hypothetical protein